MVVVVGIETHINQLKEIIKEIAKKFSFAKE
jgi:hypothetical protein